MIQSRTPVGRYGVVEPPSHHRSCAISRATEIIEAGSTYDWHSIEQPLTRAYEEDLITEETALL